MSDPDDHYEDALNEEYIILTPEFIWDTTHSDYDEEDDEDD